MSEEIFDVVNERDEVVGQAPRKEVHARGLLHRAVDFLVEAGHDGAPCGIGAEPSAGHARYCRREDQ